MAKNFLVDSGTSLKNSLKAYYKLEELSGLRWDEINLGTGPAAQFTSANSEYLSITDPANLRIGTDSFTLCFWVYFDSLSAGGNGIVSKSTGLTDSTREYDAAYDGAGNNDIEFHIYTSTSAFSARATNLGAPSTATWYFVVAWYDSSAATINIQVNNGNINSSAVTGTPNAVSSSEFAIGRYSPSTPIYLNGRVGQFGVWKRVLTTAEKAFLYNSGSGRNSRELTSSLRSSISSYWDLNESSGNRQDGVGINTLTDNNTVTQATGVSRGNTMSDNNTVTRATGKQGFAAQFTAANSEWLTTPSNTDLQTGDVAFTVAGWVYLDSKTTDRMFIARDDGGSTVEFRCSYVQSLDRFAFDIFDSSGTRIGRAAANTLGSPSTATWYYVVGWHDPSVDTVYIQINNGTVDSSSYTGVITAQSLATNMGARRPDGTDSFMDGRLEEWGFWKRLLTTQERTDLYNGGSGNTLVADGDPVGVDIARTVLVSSMLEVFD